MNRSPFTRFLVPALATVGALLASLSAQAATVVSDTTVSLSGHAGAVCNNGEPANMRVTTVADGAGISDRWFIHLQGGGSCKDDQSCQDRWENQQGNMKPSGYSSNGLPNLTRGGSPFDGYNTVQINYCSSDGWIGSRIGTVDGNGDPVIYNGTDTLVVDSAGPGTYAVHFRGKRIVDAALDEIESLYSLSTTASEVVFAGKSAGSAGVQAHLDKVEDRFGATANVRGLLMDTWVPFLPLAGTESEVRADLASLGISTATIDQLLEFAFFDADDNLQDMYDTANVWGAFNNTATEGHLGPESCFDAISGLPSVIANPSHLMLCAVADFVLNPAYNDGVTPYLSTELLILRNFYDVAVGMAAFRLFPDHDGVDDAYAAAIGLELTNEQALSELKNYVDFDNTKNLIADQNSELAVAFYSVLMPLTQSGMDAAAGAANVTVFSPGLEMTTQNCHFFNPGACSFPESQRRGVVIHGIVDIPYAYTQQVIQPYNTSALGPARTVKQFLQGWADRNSTFDYSLVLDTKLP
ncbi:pectin acetylesterase-family hydrolase [Elongatibacter sediminis]|uniref:Pectin acetylesterase-family hydrolase n=1 Tax=Elongatibacter sediminis TaxID=3119006 RepID=A0AAW9R6W9_9GAMM